MPSSTHITVFFFNHFFGPRIIWEIVSKLLKKQAASKVEKDYTF